MRDERPFPSRRSPRCPPLEALERYARSPHADRCASHDAHVAECERCRRRLARIVENRSVEDVLGRASIRGFVDAVGREEALSVRAPEIPGVEIVRELGQGGQGIVFEGLQTATRRRVAIKMLHASSLTSPTRRARFEREILLAARLRHPNCVTIYDSGTTADGRAYLVMEYVDGDPLSVDAPRTTRQDVRDALALFLKIARAVQFSHQRGIIHRDLKPGNILVDARGEPHVLDFGLAKETADDRTVLTQEAGFLGTVLYAAPEQVEGGPDDVDVRTDIYALGLVLYRMLTGAHPYPSGGALSELVRHVARTKPSPPSRVNSVVDSELSAIVLRSLEKDPERRYGSAGAFVEDVERYLAGDPVEAKRGQRGYVVRKMMRRHWLALSTASGIVLVIGALALLLADRSADLDEERRRLERALGRSRLESARAYLASNNAPAAASILYEEHLRRPSERVTWALRELHHRSPLLSETKVWKGSRSAWFDARGERVVWGDGDRTAVTPIGRPDATTWIPRPLEVSSSHAFGPSGDLLYILEEDGGIVVLDLVRGVLVKRVQAHAATSLDIEIAGDVAVSVDVSGRVRHWSLPDLRPMRSWTMPGRVIRRAGLSPDGRFLAATDAGNALGVWDLEHDPPELLAEVPCDGVRPSFDYESGRIFVNGRTFKQDWPVFAFDPAAAADKRLRQIGRIPIYLAIRTFEGGRIALVPRSLSEVQIGRIEDGRFRVEEALAAPANALRLWIVGDELGVAYLDGTVRRWDLSPQRSPRRLRVGTGTVHSVRFDASGRFLLCGTDAAAGGPSLHLVDRESGVTVSTSDAHTGPVACIDVEQDGDRIVTASHDGTCRLFRLSGLEEIALVGRHDGERVNWVRFDPQHASRIVSAGDDRRFRVWESTAAASPRSPVVFRARAELGIELELEHPRVSAFEIRPDDGSLVVGHGLGNLPGRVGICFTEGADGASDEADAGAGDIELEDPGNALGSVRSVAVDPSGRWIASGSDDRLVRVWATAPARLHEALEGHGARVYAVTFDPEGRYLASADSGGVIRVWSCSTWECLAVFESPDEGSPGSRAWFTLDFDPTGRFLAAGGAHGVVHLFDLRYYDRHLAGRLEFHRRRLAE